MPRESGHMVMFLPVRDAKYQSLSRSGDPQSKRGTHSISEYLHVLYENSIVYGDIRMYYRISIFRKTAISILDSDAGYIACLLLLPAVSHSFFLFPSLSLSNPLLAMANARVLIPPRARKFSYANARFFSLEFRIRTAYATLGMMSHCRGEGVSRTFQTRKSNIEAEKQP